jgi:hypothetical protein
MTMQAIAITSPVGRLVNGSPYEAQTADAEGKPLVFKTGPNIGKPRESWFCAIAIPKNPGETHWAQTTWGKIIWEVGHAAFPGIAARPDFAWKVEDGDSTVPNKKNRMNKDREGYPGAWILKLSNGFKPKCYDAKGENILEDGAIKCGYYVQTYFTVEGNDSQQQPGVYLNFSMVSLQGFGPEISQGPDPKAAGFGQAPLPVGASAAPVGGFKAPVPAPVAAPPVTAPAPAPVPVQPHTTILHAAPPPPGSGAAPPPPTTPHLQMSPKANGVTYDAYIKQGWTDTLLIQHGLARMTLDDNIPF